MRRHPSWLLGIYLAVACWLLIGRRISAAEAQERGSWTPPARISQSVPGASGDSARVSYPDVVADDWGGVHAFWVAVFDEDAVIGDTLYYASWDGVSWSVPVDVLYTPGKLLWMPKVVVDSTGWLHLVWTDNPAGQLWYSRAHVTEVRSAAAWEAHKTLVDGPASGAAIAVDAGGDVHIVYCGSGEYQGVYHISSSDGQAWSAPSYVGTVADIPQEYPECRLGQSVDDRGRIHAVWGQALLQDTPIYYSRSDDGGASWLPPVEIDRGDERYEGMYTPGRPNVLAVGQDEVHVVWFGAPLGQRWHRWSADGGNTWSPAEQISPLLRGFMEPPALAVDSSGTVHLVSMGWLETQEHPFGAFHTHWKNGHWSPLALVERPTISSSRSDDSSGGSEFAALAVADGNRLHLVWELGLAEIWASSLQTDAPALLPGQALPPREDPAAGVAEPTMPLPTYPAEDATPATARTSTAVQLSSPYNATDPATQALLTGIVPAALLVGFTFLVHWMRKRT